MSDQGPDIKRFLNFSSTDLDLLHKSFLFFAHETATTKPVYNLQLEALVCFGRLKDFVPVR